MYNFFEKKTKKLINGVFLQFFLTKKDKKSRKRYLWPKISFDSLVRLFHSDSNSNQAFVPLSVRPIKTYKPIKMKVFFFVVIFAPKLLAEVSEKCQLIFK